MWEQLFHEEIVVVENTGLEANKEDALSVAKKGRAADSVAQSRSVRVDKDVSKGDYLPLWTLERTT